MPAEDRSSNVMGSLFSDDFQVSRNVSTRWKESCSSSGLDWTVPSRLLQTQLARVRLASRCTCSFTLLPPQCMSWPVPRSFKPLACAHCAFESGRPPNESARIGFVTKQASNGFPELISSRLAPSSFNSSKFAPRYCPEGRVQGFAVGGPPFYSLYTILVCDSVSRFAMATTLRLSPSCWEHHV